MRHIGLLVLLMGLMSVGCRSTATTRKGVTSVDSTTKRESVLETVAKAPVDPNPVMPASHNTKSAGADCKL